MNLGGIKKKSLSAGLEAGGERRCQGHRAPNEGPHGGAQRQERRSGCELSLPKPTTVLGSTLQLHNPAASQYPSGPAR